MNEFKKSFLMTTKFTIRPIVSFKKHLQKWPKIEISTFPNGEVSLHSNEEDPFVGVDSFGREIFFTIEKDLIPYIENKEFAISYLDLNSLSDDICSVFVKENGIYKEHHITS